MPKNNPLESFLAPLPQVEALLASAPAFREFLEQALNSSGSDPQEIDLRQARYRYTDPRGVAHEREAASELVLLGSNRVSYEELLAPQLAVERKRLIHALWCIDSFEQLKAFLLVLGGIVRYSVAADGTVSGHLLLSAAIIPMIENVERREYVLANGDMASDAITRGLGLRAKVFALDRQSRTQKPEEPSLLDRLTRTFARIR